MQVHIARALDDIRHVKELTEGETWAHARKFLVAAPDDPFADHLRWLEEDGRPVACVQVFLHQYQIGCAKLGMCLPEYPFVPAELRGRGYFKWMMADLFEWMRGAGYPLAYDHGRKGLYTGRGFAPCYHHCIVLIRVPDALAVRASERALWATEGEIGGNESLFRGPFVLGRGLQCVDERWRPEPDATLLARSRNGDLMGFAVLLDLGRWTPANDKVLRLLSSWAGDIEVAAVLLRSAGEEAQRKGLEWVAINCRRSDLLARLAVLAGGELRWIAAQERDYTAKGEDVDAFHLADLRLAVEQLLPELGARRRAFTGRAPPAIRLLMEREEALLSIAGTVALVKEGAPDWPCVTLPRKAMTRAIMGYATPGELALLHEGCEVPGECRGVMDALFPPREPHLVYENWAFAGIEQFGPVP